MARTFNGTTDVITTLVPTISQGPITIAAWVFPTSLAGTQVWFYNGNDGANGYGLAYTGGFLQLFLGGLGFTSSGQSLSTNVWTHVALSRGAAGTTWFASINGTAFSMGSGNELGTATLGFFIGGDTAAGIIGRMAECGFWSAQLSTPEIFALAFGARPYQIRSQSILGYWPLDGYGHPALDRSGFNNNGKLTGTTFAPGPPLISAAPIPLVMSIPKITQFVPPPAFTLMPQIVT